MISGAMNARCYWCGCEMFSYKAVGQTHPKCKTVDHILSKPECLSQNEYNSRHNKVAACYSCNQKRSREWCKKLAAGLVVPTDWSLRMAEKERRRIQRRKDRLAFKSVDSAKTSDDYRSISSAFRMHVPRELSQAFG